MFFYKPSLDGILRIAAWEEFQFALFDMCGINATTIKTAQTFEPPNRQNFTNGNAVRQSTRNYSRTTGNWEFLVEPRAETPQNGQIAEKGLKKIYIKNA